MDFGFGIYASREVDSKVINELSSELQEYFLNKNFGQGVLDISIGIICVSKDFEPFFRPRNPKYTKGKKEEERDGITIVFEKILEYDCKIDFDLYQKNSELERKSLIANSVSKASRETFQKLKIKDFDEMAYMESLENYFTEKEYLNL
ncbi:hypothetical protein [Ulvibacterium sp.]|uniref:hypothetical protein n=1 Tax=Ulvibacterium sp. TaxID=2665914 RepID=UPI003BA910C1